MNFVINHKKLTSVCFLLFLTMAYGAVTGAHQNALGKLLMQTTRDAGYVLTHLKISGLKHTAESEVQARLNVDHGMPMMAIDLKTMQVDLETLPWVKRATITRKLPGDIYIDIIERKPFALWQSKGRVRLIDESGTVITGRDLSRFSHLVLLVGEGANHHASDLANLVSNEPHLAKRMRTAVRVGGRRWDLIFDNGVRLKMPEELDASYGAKSAWEKFSKLEIQYSLLEREISVIDLRVNGRMIMRVSPNGRRTMKGQEWAT